MTQEEIDKECEKTDCDSIVFSKEKIEELQAIYDKMLTDSENLYTESKIIML